ncbi:hypothetical protein PI126_g20415 [Phytophthora idaei]|nr:hypothetical protein PI126_g20415 [Phytophthora idaei]
MPSRVPISVWRQQGVLQWIDEEGDQVPTRAIKYFRSKGWKLDGGSVRRWWRDRAKILAADPGSLRVPGGGRRPLSAAMEEDWYDEVVAKRLKKPNVTRDWIGHMTGVIFACQHPTALVLAGDIVIYKSLKDLLYVAINAWKESDKVEYTRFGKPRMPSVGTVCQWIKKTWHDTNSSTVKTSVAAAGFANNWAEWHVARHEVYGEQLRAKWETSGEREQVEDGFNLDELHDALHDVAQIYE